MTEQGAVLLGETLRRMSLRGLRDEQRRVAGASRGGHGLCSLFPPPLSLSLVCYPLAFPVMQCRGRVPMRTSPSG